MLTQFPGPVVTEAFAEVLGTDGAEEEIAATIPLVSRTPDDIAAAVVFLTSPASRWITGRNLLVAGGRTHRATISSKTRRRLRTRLKFKEKNETQPISG